MSLSAITESARDGGSGWVLSGGLGPFKARAYRAALGRGRFATADEAISALVSTYVPLGRGQFVHYSSNPRRNPDLYAEIVADAEGYGDFYEDVIQPFIYRWAKREAKARLRGTSLHQIDTGAWESIVKQYCKAKRVPCPKGDELTRIALKLTHHFDADWSHWADQSMDDEIYPNPARPERRRSAHTNPRSGLRPGDEFTHRHPGYGFRGVVSYGRVVRVRGNGDIEWVDALGHMQPDILAADVAAKRVFVRQRKPR